MNDSKYKTNSRHRDPENRIRFHPDSEAAKVMREALKFIAGLDGEDDSPHADHAREALDKADEILQGLEK